MDARDAVAAKGSLSGTGDGGEHPQALGWRGQGAIVLGAAALIAALNLFYGSFYSLHTDLAGAALSGRLALELGGEFGAYSLYFPPVERAWFTFAALLSGATGLRLDLVVITMTAIALAFSAGLAFHIRRATTGAGALFLVGSVALLVIVPVLYKNVFGLREHLVLLGLWPYLVLRVSDPDGTRIGAGLRVLVGVWLGATLLFKYLYSLAVLLVELVDAGLRRHPGSLLRIENLLSGAIVAAYLLAWLGFDPSQREVIGAVVSAIDANLTDTRTNIEQALYHVALAGFLVGLGVITRVPARATAFGTALVVAAIAAAWIQSRWYSHHLFPITFAYIAWLWLIHRDTRLIWLVALAIILARPVFGEYLNSRIYQATTAELDAAMARSGLGIEGRRVGALTMHPSPFNQHLAMHRATRWNTSMNNSYVAAQLQPLDRPDNAGRVPGPVALSDPGFVMLHDEMLRLWEDKPPEFIVLDESTSWPLQFLEVEWRRVFAEDARFNAVLSGYEPVFAHEGEWLEFTVLQRRD